jgi:hypothetical protein
VPEKRKRRSAFDSWTDQSGEAGTPPAPPTPIDLMGAEPKKRNRGWEKSHKARPYRGVSADVHEQVVALASHLLVTTDEVAQMFVQYSLSCLANEILTISPRPKAQRMTLFPLPNGWGEQAGWSETDGWKPTDPQLLPSKRKTVQKSNTLWKYAPGYRLPDEIHDAVKRLADQHTVPLGEIMTLFLKHGLESYKTGRLRLNPQPRTVKMTLLEINP